jgi:hypothetical protein
MVILLSFAAVASRAFLDTVHGEKASFSAS